MTGPTSKNLIAVIIGAVLLFGAISVLPIVIMRRHRRRAAERHANELRHLENNGCMRQITVERWLDQQQTRSSDTHNLERYAGESCPICLTSLLAPSTTALPLDSSLSGSTIHTTLGPAQTPLPLPHLPEAAHISHSHPEQDHCSCSYMNNDDDRTRPPRNLAQNQVQVQELGPQGSRSNAQDSVSGVLILNRCNHAFHPACLASWFQYRRSGVGPGGRAQYRCPICSDVLE